MQRHKKKQSRKFVNIKAAMSKGKIIQVMGPVVVQWLFRMMDFPISKDALVRWIIRVEVRHGSGPACRRQCGALYYAAHPATACARIWKWS